MPGVPQIWKIWGKKQNCVDQATLLFSSSYAANHSFSFRSSQRQPLLLWRCWHTLLSWHVLHQANTQSVKKTKTMQVDTSCIWWNVLCVPKTNNKYINKWICIYIYINTIVNEYHSIHVYIVCTPFFFIHVGTANNLYYSKYSKSSLINRTSLSPHIFSGQKTAASRNIPLVPIGHSLGPHLPGYQHRDIEDTSPQNWESWKKDSQNGDTFFLFSECSLKRMVNFQRTQQWW